MRRLFEHYAKGGSLTETLRWAKKEGIRTKGYHSKRKGWKEPRDFTKSSLHSLLTNVHYLGKIPLKGEVFEGEHEPLISERLWRKVQDRMSGRSIGSHQPERNKTHALLRGLLFAEPDGAPMYHSFTARGNRRYRYYVHRDAIKRGDCQSPTRSVPAGDIEAFVIERIKLIGKDRKLAADNQEHILYLPRTAKGPDPLTLSKVLPIAQEMDWGRQRERFERLIIHC